MRQNNHSGFPIDNSSILYLSLIRKDHTNTYRFTINMTEPVCPETLQRAVDHIYHRFPTIIAGFQPGFFQYTQVPAKQAPKVKPDPGCLTAMSRDELQTCAFKVLYRECQIIIEAFHALTDGYGATACFTTLIAEYLRLRHNICIPVSEPLVDLEQNAESYELSDSYLEYAKGKPLHLPSRYAYQLPGGHSNRDAVYTETIQVPINQILDTSRSYGVSVTALISTVMASSIMELQHNRSSGRKKPVRIMVPVDLRRMFPSKTLRNFILYVLPTLEPEDQKKPLSSLLKNFSRQIQEQAQPERLASIMAYNVKTQNSWYFKIIPVSVKCTLMRLAYRYFGESNSSITLTNVGNVRLPEEMQPYVRNVDVTLMPRVGSPYNCGFISCNGILSIQISRFLPDSELEAIFHSKLNAVLEGESK